MCRNKVVGQHVLLHSNYIRCTLGSGGSWISCKGGWLRNFAYTPSKTPIEFTKKLGIGWVACEFPGLQIHEEKDRQMVKAEAKFLASPLSFTEGSANSPPVEICGRVPNELLICLTVLLWKITYIKHGGLFLGVVNGPEHLMFDAEVRQVCHPCDAIHLCPLIKRQPHERPKHTLHHGLLAEPLLCRVKGTWK